MVCRTPDQFDSQAQDSSGASFLKLITFDEDAVSAYTEEVVLPQLEQARTVALSKADRRKNARRRQARQIENAVFSAAAAMAVVATIAGGIHMLSAPSPIGKAMTTVTVAPGDTLWSVASRYTPAGTPTAAELNAIRTANPSLSDSKAIAVGQRILVPSAAR